MNATPEHGDSRGAAAPVDGSAMAMRVIAETVTSVGATLVTSDPQQRLMPVDHVAWLGLQRLACFRIVGGQPRVRVIEYDECCRVGHKGVAFFRREELVGYLCLRCAANLPEVDRSAVAITPDTPAGRGICRLCAELHTAARERSCVWRLCR